MLQRLMTTGLVLMIASAGSVFAAEPAIQSQTLQAHSLDLKAPNIRRIFSLAEINAVLARATDPALEHIEVEALPLGDLPLEDNSATMAETVASTVVWLLFGPRYNPTPDATDSYRPAPIMQAHHHAAFDPP